MHAMPYIGLLWTSDEMLSVKVLCKYSKGADDWPKVWAGMLNDTTCPKPLSA